MYCGGEGSVGGGIVKNDRFGTYSGNTLEGVADDAAGAVVAKSG